MTPVLLAARLGRSVVTAALVLFAVWTLVYQAALLLGLPSTATLLVAGAVGVGALVLGRRLGSGRPPLVAPLPSGAASLAVLGATVVGDRAGPGRAAHGRPRRGGARRRRRPGAHRAQARAAPTPPSELRLRTPHPPTTPPRARGCGPSAGPRPLVSGVLASVIVRPDGDDAYFVNVSTWVAERGRFPLRDTMISPDLFPALGAHSPPTHSVEGLVGAIARVARHRGRHRGLRARCARRHRARRCSCSRALVEEARIPTAPAALLASVTYLWTTGGTGYSFGSFFARAHLAGQGDARLASVCRSSCSSELASCATARPAPTSCSAPRSSPPSVSPTRPSSSCRCSSPGSSVAAARASPAARRATTRRLAGLSPRRRRRVAAGGAPPRPASGQRSAEGFAAASDASRDFDPLDTVPGRPGTPRRHLPGHRPRRPGHPQRRAAHCDHRCARRGRGHPAAGPARRARASSAWRR